MSDPVWPDHAPEPDEERGEHPETHLLPNLDRLRAMTPEQRHDLLDRARHWMGPKVEEFRRQVREIDDESPA